LSQPKQPTATSYGERLARVQTPATTPWLGGGKAAATQAPRPLFSAPAPTAAGAPGNDAAQAAVADIEVRKRDIQQAKDAAEREGLAAAQAKIEEIVERYLDGIQRLLAATRLAHRPEPGEVVELALVVAKELVGRELATDRGQLVEVIKNALTTVSADTQLVLRVSPGDATYVKQRRPELLREGVVLVEDKTLTVGGCVVETPAWVLDASIEARLEAVRIGLVDILTAAATDATRDDDDAPNPFHVAGGDADVVDIDENADIEPMDEEVAS